MRAIMESLFDIIYLITVISMGIYLLRKSGNDKETKLYGWMSIILGFGDAFHLVPRIYALNTTGMEANATALGIGKAITSVTMTIFYLMLFEIWKMRYKVKDSKNLSIYMYLLVLVRIIICLFPQNDWLNYNQPLEWSIYRNIPFAIMGTIMIVIFYQKAKETYDKHLKYMWLAILLSFAFYAPVVLWSHINESIGLFMIPKTLAYVWIVWMGYKNFKEKQNYSIK